MMKPFLLLGTALATLLAVGGNGWAQSSPFDMSGERPADVAPPAPVAPAPVAPPPAAPAPTSVAPAPATQQPATPLATPNTASPAASASAATPPTSTPLPAQRFLLPSEDFSLSGEIDRRRWAIYLTREEAAAANAVHLGYQNAIFVAPETSRLRVSLNDTMVLEESVASSDTVKDLTAEVPAGLLRPGLNTITVESSLRHRTDCTIQSTYDLWTDIDPTKTFLSFGNAENLGPQRLEDLKAVGVDGTGKTKIRIVVPNGSLTSVATSLLKLSEGLALATGMPNQSFEIIQGRMPDPAPGTLTVVAGPAASLRDTVPNQPEDANSLPTTVFVPAAESTPAYVLLSGPRWDDVAAGAERLAGYTSTSSRPGERAQISNPAWRIPDTPLLDGARSLSFAELGIPSQDFSGRRFRTDFTIGIPADFFAEAYGEATLRLDAAYSGEIRPGSRINIYVNGNIATTLPIGGSGSNVLERFPVNVTMQHLRPGANTVAFEANLVTDADEACLPGTSSNTTPRFAIFDTTTLETPDFARIAQIPNLSATSGTAFPYNRSDAPIPVVLGAEDTQTLSSAATILGRMAMTAGRVIPIDADAPMSAANERSTLFVGAARQIPSGVFEQIGVAPTLAPAGSPNLPAATSQSELTLDRWREQVGPSRFDEMMGRFETWLNETFGITLEGLRLAPQADTVYSPAPGTSLIVAQGAGPGEKNVWTVVSAPDAEMLASGTAQAAAEDTWHKLSGRVTSFAGADAEPTQIPVGKITFVSSQPTSLSNLRLIAANWLSENVLSYAALLVAISLLLGITTTAFVRFLGRQR